MERCIGQGIGGGSGARKGMVHRTSMSSGGAPPFQHLGVFTNPEALQNLLFRNILWKFYYIDKID